MRGVFKPLKDLRETARSRSVARRWPPKYDRGVVDYILETSWRIPATFPVRLPGVGRDAASLTVGLNGAIVPVCRRGAFDLSATVQIPRS